jgi:U3 small nucleolar RNA-associated protein 14
VRRAKVTLDLGRDETVVMQLGAMDDDEREALRVRLVGEGGEDEEIDSDAAFEESDEERFAGFSFKNSRNTKVRRVSSLSPDT